MSSNISVKLKQLPKSPGVYFHKDKSGEIIYVGKAAVLSNRVRQYFQKSRYRDPKTDLLVSEIYDTDWLELGSEAEALFVEAEMVRRYQPKYNILLRDDKSVCFVRINLKDIAPSVTITRRPLDDGANYFGPFLSAGPVRKSLKYLRKIFPYSTHITLPSRGCLQTHIGLCPGPEADGYNRNKYLGDLKKLILYLKGQSVKLTNQLQNEMQVAAKNQNYEQAAKLRNQIMALKSLRTQIIFSDRENLDLSKDHALYDLYKLLNLKDPPRRIEGYDISHMSGTDTVASMVVFSNGVSNKSAYRKFKMRILGNDDFAHMNEVITRRFSNKNIKQWGLPDLVLIDGGKGQLAAAIKARNLNNINVPMIGLAKKHEELIISNEYSNVIVNDKYLSSLKGYITNSSQDFIIIDLPNSSNLVKLLQRIRDESHRFAVSYHSTLKINRQKTSILDSVNGIGPKTKKSLIRHFGSVKAIQAAEFSQIVGLIGNSKASKLRPYLNYDNDK